MEYKEFVEYNGKIVEESKIMLIELNNVVSKYESLKNKIYYDLDLDTIKTLIIFQYLDYGYEVYNNYATSRIFYAIRKKDNDNSKDRANGRYTLLMQKIFCNKKFYYRLPTGIIYDIVKGLHYKFDEIYKKGAIPTNPVTKNILEKFIDLIEREERISEIVTRYKNNLFECNETKTLIDEYFGEHCFDTHLF